MTARPSAPKLHEVCAVVGPGATTYARDAAPPRIVVIPDVLAWVRPLTDDPDPPPHLRHLAIGARNAALERARTLREDVGVWVIDEDPTEAALRRYIRHGFRILHAPATADA